MVGQGSALRAGAGWSQILSPALRVYSLHLGATYRSVSTVYSCAMYA
jgi:hypothetical protein